MATETPFSIFKEHAKDVPEMARALEAAEAALKEGASPVVLRRARSGLERCEQLRGLPDAVYQATGRLRLMFKEREQIIQ